MLKNDSQAQAKERRILVCKLLGQSGNGARENQAMDIIRLIFAIILPPVGVFLQVGFGLHFWINILLTLMGYLPGIIHAVWIIARR